MVEIVLILSLGALAAVLAAVLTRWVLSQALGSTETARVLGAVRRAGDDFAWKQGKRSLLAVTLLGLVLLGLRALGQPQSDDTGLPLWTAAGVAAGAACSILVGQLAVQVAPRASARVAAAMLRATHSHAVSVGLRSGGALALAVDALALLLVSATMLFLGSASAACPAVLLGLAVGAVLAAFWSQITGGAVHYAGQIGRRERRLGGQRERFDLDVKNPTMVLDLVGNHVGVSTTRTQDVFCTSLLLHAGLVSIATWVWQANGGATVDPSLLIALPVLIRGFGLFATGVALISSRADASDDPSAILWRGQVAVAGLCLTCLAGLGVWLLGDTWVPWFTAGALGIGANLVVGFSRQHLTDRRRAGLKELKDAASLSPTLALASGVTSSLCNAWPILGALGVGVALASFVGEASGWALGTTLALALLVAGYSMGLPFLASLTLFDPIVDGGCALASLDAQRRPEVKHRSVRMNQAALAAGAVGRGHLLSVGALLGLLAIIDLWRSAAAFGDSVFQMASAYVLCAGASLGLALVLGFGGAAISHAARTAADVATELQRQLNAFIHDAHGQAQLPEEFRPRYNEHLSLVCQRALRARAFAPLSVLLFPPLLVAAVIHFSDGGAAQALVLLMAVLTLTTSCGFIVALAAEGTWSLVSAARRHTRAADPIQLGALNLADGVAEFAGNTVSPSAQLTAKAVIAMSLVAALVLF